MDYNSVNIQMYNPQSNYELKLSLTSKLDQLPFSNWHIFVVICLGCSWVFDGFEVSLLSLTSSTIQSYFNVNETKIGNIASVYLSGCIVGAIIFGYLSTEFGRKKLFQMTLMIYLTSVIAISFTTNYYIFLICRFFTGVGVGGEYTAIFAAVDELIPPKVRGRVDIILDGTWHLGTIISSITTILIYNQEKYKNDIFVWRFLYLIGGLAAIPFIFLRNKIPESPRWLINHGKYREAYTIIQQIEKKVLKEKYFETRQIEDEDERFSELGNNKKLTLRILFSQLFVKYRSRFILGITLMASQSFFYNGIFYTFTMVLKNFYKVEQNNAGYFMLPIAFASVIGPIFLGKYFDTVGRRFMTCFTYICSGMLLATTAVFFYSNYLNLVNLNILWFITFFIASPGASSAHLTISELFPSEMRSQAMAVFFSLGQAIGGVVAPTFFSYLISEHSRFNISLGYYMASIFMIFAGVVAYFLAIDAENKSLEEIQLD